MQMNALGRKTLAPHIGLPDSFLYATPYKNKTLGFKSGIVLQMKPQTYQLSLKKIESGCLM
jgi:hypothetical protein